MKSASLEIWEGRLCQCYTENSQTEDWLYSLKAVRRPFPVIFSLMFMWGRGRDHSAAIPSLTFTAKYRLHFYFQCFNQECYQFNLCPIKMDESTFHLPLLCHCAPVVVKIIHMTDRSHNWTGASSILFWSTSAVRWSRYYQDPLMDEYLQIELFQLFPHVVVTDVDHWIISRHTRTPESTPKPLNPGRRIFIQPVFIQISVQASLKHKFYPNSRLGTSHQAL